MIVTPFGDLEYKDPGMTLQWLAAHGLRHRTLRKELSRRGTTISPASLFGRVDLEWTRLHYLSHVAMLRVLLPDSSVSVQVLSANPMDSEPIFYSWHQMHNLLHTRLDQALGVV